MHVLADTIQPPNTQLIARMATRESSAMNELLKEIPNMNASVKTNAQSAQTQFPI